METSVLCVALISECAPESRPNLAGKTTAVKLLLGLIQPTSGKMRVFSGDPINQENRMRTVAMLQVARVPEMLRV
jgi:ABC-2 type transport system ATP-binding protein